MNIAQFLFMIALVLSVTSLFFIHDKQSRVYDEDHRTGKRNR